MNYRVLFCFCALSIIGCKSYEPLETKIDFIRVSEADVTADQSIDATIAPYRSEMAEQMDVIIGELDTLLTKERPESNLGNWLADMLLEEVNEILPDRPVDFSVQNQGGIRVINVAPGPITIGEVFEVMPFDNKVAVITATGAETKVFFDHLARGRGWPVSAGTSFKIKNGKAIDIKINGTPLIDENIYRFAIPDYIANGGSGSDFLREYEREDVNRLIRELFVEHIEEDTADNIIQTAQKEGRIINTDHE
ncbi:MAG: 5'-nucleotidase C-terminal domain-containing protein [Bacteroidota bacterium]